MFNLAAAALGIACAAAVAVPPALAAFAALGRVAAVLGGL